MPAGAHHGKLRILLLGGFEVWHEGQQLRGFESQKVRALFAYLALRRGHAASRDHLAGMFWGEKDEESARRNLRQALYNLKATIPGEDTAQPHLVVDSQEVRFNSESDYWLDVDAFESAVGSQGHVASVEHLGLATASQLYRGDLLTGFFVKDCTEFEEWLVTEQERLRETALHALRRLVDSYLARGEYRLGIQHARRLVAMDPLSEEAHRHLLRLYELGGRRGQALAHYADLREMLRRELGVEPLAETRTLYESILTESLRAEAVTEKPAPLGPIVPLVGRQAALAALAECWQAVLDGGFQVTLLAGEEGVGRTRLARSFLDGVTSRRRATVLTCGCLEQFPQPVYRPLAEALRQGLPEDPTSVARLAAAMSRDCVAALVPILPELEGASEPTPSEPPSHVEGGTPERRAEAVAAFLRQIAPGAGDGGDPVILFLDDLHSADHATLALVESLVAPLTGSRTWLVATYSPAGLAPDSPLTRLAHRDGDGMVTRIDLERLGFEAIEEIANSLVAPQDVPAVAGLLTMASEGLPLALVALVNTMWDEGELEPEPTGGWRFRGAAARWDAPARDGLDRLLLRRLRRLPTSTRRLATLAAVIGQRFDTELLQRAEDEHISVVEIGLELLLERWLVRQHRPQWNVTGLERSLTLWSRGARRGRFEFDHIRIRRAISLPRGPGILISISTRSGSSPL